MASTSPTPAPQPVTMTIPGSIAFTGIGRTKLYELIRDGKIETVKIGTRTLVKVESLRQLVAA